MHGVEGDKIYSDGTAEMGGVCVEENVEMKNFTFECLDSWMMISQ